MTQRPLWPDEAIMLNASRTKESDQLEAWSDVYYQLEDEAELWAAKDHATGRWLPLLDGRGPEYASRLNALLDAFPEIPTRETAWRPEAVTTVIRFTPTP
jgi:hypothetical protein